MIGVVLHAHPVRGELHNQRNTTGEVATLRSRVRETLLLLLRGGSWIRLSLLVVQGDASLRLQHQ